jgi:hypothetical protein
VSNYKVNISIGRFIDTNEHVRVWGESMACQCCMELSQLLILECIKYGNSFCLGCMIPEDHGCPGTDKNFGSYFAILARINT